MPMYHISDNGILVVSTLKLKQDLLRKYIPLTMPLVVVIELFWCVEGYS